MDEIPTSILIALSRLSGIKGVAVESSPEYISAESSWAFRLRLSSSHSSDFVPKDTHWVVLIDGSYPAGPIRIYPAVSGGLSCTFPHQARNIVLEQSDIAWRTGKPCLDSPSQRLGRIAGGPEPRGDAEQRLRWYIQRCLAWLEIAATDQLMVSDEPFEVPQCPIELLDTRFNIVHDEGNDTWPSWTERLGDYGEVRWGLLTGFEKAVVAEEFFDANGSQIRCCRRRAQSDDKPWIGYWWLWPSPIVIPPWYAPGTWAELRQLGAKLKVDVDRFIWWLAHRAGGKESIILLLGYPIPALWNGAPVEVHWQAILPPLVPAQIKPLNGFRANQVGECDRLRRDIFSGTKKLRYMKTVNWHPDRLQARGRLNMDARTRSVALIGAGALGSAVAELLARGGVAEMLIIDYDELEAGNLVRHMLNGADIGCNKATAMTTRLQSISPMLHVTPYTRCLPRGEALQELLEPYDVVLDCTGDDEVLRFLSEGWWPIPRYFLSVSLGFAANRLFVFTSHSCSFSFEDFEIAIRPWLAQERMKWAAAGETFEGAGCWSPLFPARCDDVWLAAIATVKRLEMLVSRRDSDGLRVFEKCSDEDLACYKSVEIDPDMSLPNEGVDR